MCDVLRVTYLTFVAAEIEGFEAEVQGFIRSA